MFIDPSRKRVFKVFGVFFSRSANPYACAKTVLPTLRRGQHLKKIDGYYFIQPLSQSGDQLIVVQVTNSKLHRSWEHLKLKLRNSVWRRWLDLNGKLRELLAQAFLDQQDDFGWCRLRDFHDVETTSPASHFCFAPSVPNDSDNSFGGRPCASRYLPR